MISSSQEKGIDLNAKENLGLTALHVAGMNGNTEIVQVFLENWREFGIDMKARDVVDETALDKIKHRHYYSYSHYEPYVHIKRKCWKTNTPRLTLQNLFKVRTSNKNTEFSCKFSFIFIFINSIYSINIYDLLQPI